MNIVSVSTGIIRNESNVNVTLTISGVNQLKVTNVNFEVWDSVNHSTYSTSFVMGRGVTTATVTIPVSAIPLYNTWYQAMVHIYNSDTQQSRTFPNTFYRDPTPTKLLGLSPESFGTVRDEKNRDMRISYTSNNTNGICNCYKLICTDTTTQTVWLEKVYQLGNTSQASSDVSVETTFTFKNSSFVIKHNNKFEFISGFSYYANPPEVDEDGNVVKSYMWATSSKIVNNAYYRDPTPINSNAIELRINNTFVTGSTCIVGDSLDLKVSYQNSQDNGIATGCQIDIYDDSDLVLRLYNDDVYSEVNNKVTFVFDTMPMSDIDPDYLCKPLKINVMPYFKSSGGTRYYSASLTKKDVFEFNAGIEDPEILAPVGNTGLWFYRINTVNPTFKIAIKLPTDKNEDYLPEGTDFSYQDVIVDLLDSNLITPKVTFKVSSNPNHFGLTDNALGYKSLLMFSLNAEGDNSTYSPSRSKSSYSDDLYYFRITVKSSSGVLSNGYTQVSVKMRTFPVNESSARTGQPITANRVYEFFKADQIIRSWTNVDEWRIGTVDDLKGQIINYNALYSLYDGIYALYEVTKDYNNPMKYSIPMMLVDDGEGGVTYQALPYGYDNRGNPNVSDYIYENTRSKSISLAETYSEPSDYSTDFAKYFQKSENFVFRSPNSVYKSSEVYSTPTGDYNVFYSYYMLLLSIAGVVEEYEDWEGFIAGTYSGTLIVNAEFLTKYSLSNLPALTRVVLNEEITSLPEGLFNGSSGIIQLIILNNTSVLTFATNVLTPLKDAGTIVKVPADLVSAYQAADVWKTLTIEAL